MTLPSKPLRIMRDSYVHYQHHHYYYEKGLGNSLMSPPLTPTEMHHPTTTTSSPIIQEEGENDNWYYYQSKRKQFIISYSKMVPFLRKSPTSNDGGSVFALNVYRDLLLLDSKQGSSNNGNNSNHSSSSGNNSNSSTNSNHSNHINHHNQIHHNYHINSINSNKINKKNDDCVMLDKTVVAHSRKRKLCEQQQEQQQDKKKVFKRKRISSVLPTGKEAAIAFDSINIDLNDQEFYPIGWVPFKNALDQIPVKVYWKGAPLLIHQQPYYHILHKVEASMASILRLSPIQYLRCKRTLILAARTLKLQQIPFTKSVAQKLCRVDVNKTSALWTVFGQLGWFDNE